MNKYRKESVSGGFGINTSLGENIFRDICDCGARFEVNEKLGLHENLKAARAALDLYHVLKYAPDLFEDVVITTTTGFAGKAIKGAEGLIVTYGPQTYEILMDIRDGNWDNVLVDLEKDAFFTVLIKL